MRWRISIKGFILTLVIFFIGVSSFFYFFLYRPKLNKVIKQEREVSRLAERIEERPHGLPPRIPPGMRCVDCHLQPAPPN
jgi:hypothetical protein